MKVKYVDYDKVEMKDYECFQVVFTLDKDNAICFKTENESIKDALKVPKENIQWKQA